MRSLELYIKENQQITLSEYINFNDELICEGIFGWLKKALNWIFRNTKENVKKNNGRYTSPELAIDAAENNKPIKDKIKFVLYQNENFDNLMKTANSNDKKIGTFYRAQELNNSNKNYIKFVGIINNKPFVIIFCTNKKQNKKVKIKHVVFGQDIVHKNKNIIDSAIAQQTINEINTFIKNYNDYKIQGPVNQSVIDNTKYDEYELKNSNETTN